MRRRREIIEIPAKQDAGQTTPKRQLRVAAYCRVSTNLESQQNSYQVQRDHYTDLIASNPNWVLAMKSHLEEGARKRPAVLKNAGELERVVCQAGIADG